MVFNVIWLIIIGTAAGFLATRIMKRNTDIPTTILIGIGGALIGGLVLPGLLAVMGMFAGLIGAVLGAMALIWLWEQYGKK